MSTLHSDLTGAQLHGLGLAAINEFMNFPSIEGADGAQPEWWEESAGTATLTEEDVAGEGITESYARALKLVTTADVYASQRFTYADQQRLKSGQVVSMLVAVWAVGGVTARVRLQSSVGSLGVQTTTAAAWTILEVPAVTLDGTWVEARFEVNNGTAYFVPLGLNKGYRGVELPPRGLRERWRDGAQLLDLAAAATNAWTDCDATSLSSNIAAMLLLTGILWADTGGDNQIVNTRRKGSSEANSSLNAVFQAVNGTNEIPVQRWLQICDDLQVFQFYLNVGGTPGAGSRFGIVGWLEWE